MGDGESRPAGSDGKSIHGAGNAEMAEQAFCMVAGVAAGWRTVVVPSANMPANRMALLTWALAMGSA